MIKKQNKFYNRVYEKDERDKTREEGVELIIILDIIVIQLEEILKCYQEYTIFVLFQRMA